MPRQLTGKKLADKLDVTVLPENAYGPRKEELIRVLPIEGFEGDEELVPGMRIQLDTENGALIADVLDVTGDEVTIDMNHPLAGMVLHFNVEIIGLRAATEIEIAHGHVHGKGGCDH